MKEVPSTYSVKICCTECGVQKPISVLCNILTQIDLSPGRVEALVLVNYLTKYKHSNPMLGALIWLRFHSFTYVETTIVTLLILFIESLINWKISSFILLG